MRENLAGGAKMKKIKVSILFIIMSICMLFAFACGGNLGKLESISISGYQKEFTYGEEFTVGDLVVTAKYDSGKTKKVTDYVVDDSKFDSTTAGKYNITIRYTEGDVNVKKSYIVTVGESNVVAGLELTGLKTEYSYGESFSFYGTVQEKYEDGRLVAVASGYEIDDSAYNGQVAGTYEIKVSYNGNVATYNVQVLPSTVLKSFTFSGQTTQFTIGDSFVFDGIVSATYEDGRTVEDATGYVVDSSSFDALKLGGCEIKITMGGQQKTYTVTVQKATTLKLLMIGNSFSQDTAEWIPKMAETLGFEDVIVGNLVIGGCNLSKHYQNAINNIEAYEFDYTKNGVRQRPLGNKSQSIGFGVAYEAWDFVSLQQVSGESGIPNTYNQDLEGLIGFIKETTTNPDIKFIWNMTWSYRSDYSQLGIYGGTQEKMYNAIVSTVQAKIVPHPDFCGVNPAGTAIQNAKTSYLGIDYFYRDGLHLTELLGRYIAGLTMLCSITGYTPNEISFVPNGISASEVAIAKESVQNALNNKFAVTQSQYKTAA